VSLEQAHEVAVFSVMIDYGVNEEMHVINSLKEIQILTKIFGQADRMMHYISAQITNDVKRLLCQRQYLKHYLNTFDTSPYFQSGSFFTDDQYAQWLDQETTWVDDTLQVKTNICKRS
jgi:hypothetical protein